MHVICPAAVNDTVLSTHSDHPYHRANVAPSSLEVSPSSAKPGSAPRLWYPSLCSPGLAGGPSRPDLQAQETEGGGDGCASSNPWKMAPPSHLGSSEKNHQAGAETLRTFLENRNSVFRLVGCSLQASCEERRGEGWLSAISWPRNSPDGRKFCSQLSHYPVTLTMFLGLG